jgi:hypothetical protein
MGAADYCIRVKGHLAPERSDWFEGMTVHPQPDGTTILSDPVRDQSPLQGLLLKVRDLGWALISVNPIEFNPEKSHTVVCMIKLDRRGTVTVDTWLRGYETAGAI